jgi:energy-coupling factor transporter ATP-binding protein EcfA2
VAFGPANLGVRGAELEARVQEGLDAVGMTDVVPPRTTCRSASGAG